MLRAGVSGETSPRRVLLILGCQRSGTSFLSELFDHDRRVVTFSEESELTSRGGAPMRLNPLPNVDRHLAGMDVPLVVLKPLVESQRAPELLASLRDAIAVWMYRHYRDVAASSVRTFGADNAIRDIELLLSNDPPTWRGELVPEETKKTIQDLFAHSTDALDAAALFWWARNMLFFQRELDKRPDVKLVAYEMLVERTTHVMRDVYEFLGIPFPNQRLDRAAHARALGRGRGVSLSPPVEEICGRLYERLGSAAR
jgi:hypothetical protein